jgi:hypothetical protein
MRDHAVREDQIDRALAEDLVGDVHVVYGLGVVVFGISTSVHHSVAVPAVGNAFQLVFAGVLEGETRSRHEVFNGL